MGLWYRHLMDSGEPVRRRQYRRVSFDRSLREVLREKVDPEEVAETLLAAMRDPSASWKDRLAAVKQISDRRDGLPVATVISAAVSTQRYLRDVPDVVLSQLEGLLRDQLQLTPGEGEEDDEAPGIQPPLGDDTEYYDDDTGHA